MRRNQNDDELLQQVQHANEAADHNLTAMVERIMARNGLNTGFYRPSYTSPLDEFIIQSDLPPIWKVPKFTMFSEDTTESTVEHVARYLIEAGEIVGNENLRVNFSQIP